MEIKREDIFFHLYSISEMFRKYNVESDLSISEIYDLIPYGVIRDSIYGLNIITCVEWVMKFLGYKYDDAIHEWIK